MNNIYAKKAKKYKYKYLKLKQEYFGEGGNPLLNAAMQDYNNRRDRRVVPQRAIEIQGDQWVPARQAPNFYLDNRQVPARLAIDPQQHVFHGDYGDYGEYGDYVDYRVDPRAQLQQQALNRREQVYQRARDPRAQIYEGRAQSQVHLQQQALDPLALQRRAQSQVYQRAQIYQQAQDPRALDPRAQDPRAQQQQRLKEYQEQQKFLKKIDYNIQVQIQNLDFVGSGGFGCLISPPLIFGGNIKQVYPETTIDLNVFNNKIYVGKLISYNKQGFETEYNEFLRLEEIDPDALYRSKLIFASIMTTQELLRQLRIHYRIPAVLELETCIKDKSRGIINNVYNQSLPQYAYIISTKVGTSFDKLINDGKDHIILAQLSQDDIIKLLINLNECIEHFIRKILYNKNFIHGDLKTPNITIDKNYKIFIIDFGFMQKYNEFRIINNMYTSGILQYSSNGNYPDILYTFDAIFKKYDNMSRIQLIGELNNQKNWKKNIPGLHPLHIKPHYDLLNIAGITYIDYSQFFESITDNDPHSNKDYINLVINPIARNIDIYALTIIICELFVPFCLNNYTPRIRINNKNNLNIIYDIIKMLAINVLYNNIDGPEELLYYFNEIINSLQNTNNHTIYIKNIKDNIFKRRNSPEYKLNKDNIYIKEYRIYTKDGYEKYENNNKVGISYQPQPQPQPQQQWPQQQWR
jgi:serine/threonine protein kinase